MRFIVASSLRFRFLVMAAAAALMFFGVQELHDEKVDVFPEFAPTRVEIQTACLGLSAQEVEELVSVPLEDALNGVSGVETVRSESVPQLSNITLLFKRGTDVLKARQLVQERLQTVEPTLPTWAAPPFLMQPVSATSRIMKIGLSSKRIGLMDLSLTAYWKIRARLLRVHGVANVAIWGERLKQMQVDVDPSRLRTERVSLDRVMQVTSDALDAGLLRFSNGAVIGTGGFVETPNQRLSVRHSQTIVTPTDLAQIPVAERGGRQLRIGDVARVAYGPQPAIGDAVVNGGPGLLLVVEKFQGANTLDVTKGVEDALRDLRPGLPGVEIDSHIFRPASFIEIAIHNLGVALLLGCLFVVFVLIAFLYEWRAAFISLIAIPLSLIAAGLVLDIRGATINTMILAGFVVAVGVVVDDAIIDMENIIRRLRLRRAEGSTESIASIILHASLEVRIAILYATLINVVAVLPVVLVGGLSGAFFRPLALSYALAVIASMAVALTVTPALSLILLTRAPLKRRQSPLVRVLKRGYGAVLSRVIHAPRGAYLVVAAVLLLGLVVYPRLGQELFPGFKERDFLMHWITPPGTSIPEERRIVTRASHELRSVDGVRDFGSHIGQAFLGEEIAGSNFGENWVSVDPNANYDKTLAGIHAVVDQHPGLYRNVQTYLRERIEEVLSGEGEPIVVRLFGDDLSVLQRTAHQLQHSLADVPGLTELHTELQQDVPQIDVRVKLDVAERYGIKPGDVRRAAATLMSGIVVGNLYEEQKVFEVVVWSDPETRHSLSSVRDLMIDTPGNGHVRLGEVAKIQVVPASSAIRHDAVKRYIDVTADVEKRDLAAVAGDIEGRLKQLQFPLEYHAEVLGDYATAAADRNHLITLVIAAAFGMFILLQAAFRNWRLAALAFFTLPAALAGGALAALATGHMLSIGAIAGLYAVLGIAVCNKIMLITRFQSLERYEGEPFGAGLVVRGAGELLSPILMTTLAAGAVVLPALLVGDVPGLEIVRPMAVVVLGGLVTSGVLDLLVMPALFLSLGVSSVHELDPLFETPRGQALSPIPASGAAGD